MPGRLAAAIIGVHAVVCAVFAVFFPLVAASGASLSNASHVMFSVFTLLFSVGLAVVARGLWRGIGWPRTAAVVWLLLLLPVGWALVQAGSEVWGSAVLASAVVGIVAVGVEARGRHTLP